MIFKVGDVVKVSDKKSHFFGQTGIVIEDHETPLDYAVKFKVGFVKYFLACELAPIQYSAHFDPSTSIWTAPTDGRYIVTSYGGSFQKSLYGDMAKPITPEVEPPTTPTKVPSPCHCGAMAVYENHEWFHADYCPFYKRP